MLSWRSAWLVVAALFASACTGAGRSDTGSVTGTPRATVAFIMVGASDDLGYNEAVYDGSLDVARRFPDVEIIRVEGVPESDEVTATMTRLIEQDGADLIFATSFGYGPYAYEVAAAHPDVVIVHQGGVPEPDPALPNFGTYFGSHWEAMYEAGIAAGHATQTGRLGFVAAFPIPATFGNVNAFTLGAQRVRADVVTEVAFTLDWCDPTVQAPLTTQLIDGGADVLAMHQDCTSTILETAEQAGIAGVVGYHADGSEVARTRWLAGAVWHWGPLYNAIVSATIDGDFAASPYTSNFRGSLADGNNPFALTDPGPAVTEVAAAAMAEVHAELVAGGSPFTGPIQDRDGRERVPAGDVLTVAEVDRMDWFVPGVIGDPPA